jgi:hypothetical protein
MDEHEFKARTKKLALKMIELVQALQNTGTADVLGRQLLGSATSVGSRTNNICPGFKSKMLRSEKSDNPKSEIQNLKL